MVQPPASFELTIAAPVPSVSPFVATDVDPEIVPQDAVEVKSQFSGTVAVELPPLHETSTRVRQHAG